MTFVQNQLIISPFVAQIGCTKEQKSLCLPFPHLALLSLAICSSAWSQSVSRVLLLLLISSQIRGNPSDSLVNLFFFFLSYPTFFSHLSLKLNLALPGLWADSVSPFLLCFAYTSPEHGCSLLSRRLSKHWVTSVAKSAPCLKLSAYRENFSSPYLAHDPAVI